MSDLRTLRTRIAAVIRREVPCHPPAADRIADAVIRELNLLKEDGECFVLPRPASRLSLHHRMDCK